MCTQTDFCVYYFRGIRVGFDFTEEVKFLENFNEERIILLTFTTGVSSGGDTNKVFFLQNNYCHYVLTSKVYKRQIYIPLYNNPPKWFSFWFLFLKQHWVIKIHKIKIMCFAIIANLNRYYSALISCCISKRIVYFKGIQIQAFLF